jgi:hypothetical protein
LNTYYEGSDNIQNISALGTNFDEDKENLIVIPMAGLLFKQIITSSTK